MSPLANAVDSSMARPGDEICVRHAPSLESLRALQAGTYGGHLDAEQLQKITVDISHERYTDVHIVAFLSACASGRMTIKETIGLTQTMVDSGERLQWDRAVVADKHCVGGLPGDHINPIAVAVYTAMRLLLSKTSSRAITSPVGIVNMMETLTRVSLNTTELRCVVGQIGASLTWNGASSLSSTDDVSIQMEKALDVDSDTQLVTSALSKEIAAGSTHALVDMPMGPTAKVRSIEDLGRPGMLSKRVAQASGVQVLMVCTDGVQSVGRGIGPALEARGALAVLQRTPIMPFDLRERSLLLAGTSLEFRGTVVAGTGFVMVTDLLDSGAVWREFKMIHEAQGGLHAPGEVVFRRNAVAEQNGIITYIDNRHLARIVKLAGVPMRQIAGAQVYMRLRDQVNVGQSLFTIHAQASGELEHSSAYILTHAVVGLSPIDVGWRRTVSAYPLAVQRD